MQEVSVYEVRDAVNAFEEGVMIVDVRTPEEYAEGHIAGALNISLDVLERRTNELSGYERIYLYCRSGGRSGQACSVLSSLGLENTFTMTGGLLTWQKLGLPIER